MKSLTVFLSGVFMVLDVVWLAVVGKVLTWLGTVIGLDAPWWAWPLLFGLAFLMYRVSQRAAAVSERVSGTYELLSKQLAAVGMLVTEHQAILMKPASCWSLTLRMSSA